MIRVIMGERGMGKTKMIIDMVNCAVHEEKGDVVCLSRDRRFVFDINHRARLIDTDTYKIDSYKTFYGFLCGILSQNFDITHIFIDSLTKMVKNGGLDELSMFLPELEKLSSQFNITFTITISGKAEYAPDEVKKYFYNELREKAVC